MTDHRGQVWLLVARTRRRVALLRASADLLWAALLPPFAVWVFVVAEHLGSHESAQRAWLRGALRVDPACEPVTLRLIALAEGVGRG